MKMQLKASWWKPLSSSVERDASSAQKWLSKNFCQTPNFLLLDNFRNSHYADISAGISYRSPFAQLGNQRCGPGTLWTPKDLA